MSISVEDFIYRVRSAIRVYDDRIQDIEIVRAGRTAQQRLQRELEATGSLNLKKTMVLTIHQVIPPEIESIIRCLDTGISAWYITDDGTSRIIEFVPADDMYPDPHSFTAVFEVRTALTPIGPYYHSVVDFPDYLLDTLINATVQLLIPKAQRVRERG